MTDTAYYQAEQKKLTVRYYDLVNKPQKVDDRTAEQIIHDVFDKANIEIVKEGEE